MRLVMSKRAWWVCVFALLGFILAFCFFVGWPWDPGKTTAAKFGSFFTWAGVASFIFLLALGVFHFALPHMRAEDLWNALATPAYTVERLLHRGEFRLFRPFSNGLARAALLLTVVFAGTAAYVAVQDVITGAVPAGQDGTNQAAGGPSSGTTGNGNPNPAAGTTAPPAPDSRNPLGNPRIGASQLFSFLTGIVTVLAFIQVAWVRRFLEFHSMSAEKFMTILIDVLRSVDKNANKAAYYHLCMVHDPMVPMLLRLGHRSSVLLKEYVNLLDQVVGEKAIKKHFGMLQIDSDMDGTQPVFSENLCNNRLFAENVKGAQELFLGPVKRNAPAWNESNFRQDYVAALRNPGRHSEHRQPEEVFDGYLSDSRTLFHGLFCDGRAVCSGDHDVELRMYRGEPESFPSVNIFASNTEALLVFFDKIPGTNEYSISGMPVRNPKFVSVLKTLFDSLTSVTNDWSKFCLTKNVSPSSPVAGDDGNS